MLRVVGLKNIVKMTSHGDLKRWSPAEPGPGPKAGALTDRFRGRGPAPGNVPRTARTPCKAPGCSVALRLCVAQT
jgi:hypothetical protein